MGRLQLGFKVVRDTFRSCSYQKNTHHFTHIESIVAVLGPVKAVSIQTHSVQISAIRRFVEREIGVCLLGLGVGGGLNCWRTPRCFGSSGVVQLVLDGRLDRWWGVEWGGWLEEFW